MDVREAVEEYHLAHLHLARYTRLGHKHQLAVFVAYCEAHSLTLESINARHVRAFLEEVRKRPGRYERTVRTSTVRLYAQTVKAFLAWVSSEEDFESLVSPKLARRIELPKADETVIETFSEAQLEAMLKATEKQFYPVRDKAILAVLIDTGCRAGELVDLTLDCVWLDTDDSYLKVRGKGRKERELTLGRTARAALRRYITRYRKPHHRAEQHVFLGRSGRPLTVSGLESIITQLGSRAHIQGVRISPHTIRHSFATRFLSNGGDIFRLSRLMGHTQVSVTEIYLKSVKARQARQGGQSVLDHLKGL